MGNVNLDVPSMIWNSGFLNDPDGQRLSFVRPISYALPLGSFFTSAPCG